MASDYLLGRYKYMEAGIIGNMEEARAYLAAVYQVIPETDTVSQTNLEKAFWNFELFASVLDNQARWAVLGDTPSDSLTTPASPIVTGPADLQSITDYIAAE